MTSKTLSGRKAIVTGGSRGIGKGLAIELADRGADVLITYTTSKNKATDVVEEIKQLGVDAIMVQADGSDREAPARVVTAAVDKWGRVDILVNNAGFGYDLYLKDLTYEMWDKHMETNVTFPTFLTQAVLPHISKGGRIINVSSVAARSSTPMYTAYSASKAALEALTRVWGKELGQKYEVTVNAVNPGPVGTEMWFSSDPALLEAAQARIRETPAAPRIGTIDDIAQIVGFLAEEKSRWVTSSVVNANGGMLPV